jgi:hypothetical protein
MYWFKRKYQQIKRVIDFFPIIWKGFDFDYIYSIELFKKQLERQATFLESDRAMTLEAQNNAKKIRTALRLMDKVHDEEYSCEYQDKIKELYGEDALDWEFVDTGKGDNSTYMKYKYEKWNNADEIKEVERKLFKEAQEKQKRAHKLLWDFIEHNIQSWWD